MNFKVEKDNDIAIIVIPIENLEIKSIDSFEQGIAPVMESNTKIIFDMSQMQFIDSSGCGALLTCLRERKAKGGKIKMCGVTGPVGAIFRLIRMEKMFEIFNTREDAIEAFNE